MSGLGFSKYEQKGKSSLGLSCPYERKEIKGAKGTTPIHRMMPGGAEQKDIKRGFIQKKGRGHWGGKPLRCPATSERSG